MATNKWYQGPVPLPHGVFVSSLPAKSYYGKEPSFLTGANGSGIAVWPSFSLANGIIGVAYSQSWDLAPALSPTTYSIVSGSLPPGLSLSNISGDQGQITGTPTTVGTYTFTIRATNSLGTSDKSFSITISVVAQSGAAVYIS